MAKVSKEVVENRPSEIVKACRELYKSFSFQEIGFKEISREAGISRPTIYNYFQTKEEVFLALLEDEYRLWGDDLGKMVDENDSLNSDLFAERIASSLQERELLLKIQCMNLYEIEEHSREERLEEFKVLYGRAMGFIEKALEKFFPLLTEADRDGFILEFFPFMYGIFPYVHPTVKQMTAMRKAGMKERRTTTYDITRKCVSDLMKAILKDE